MLEDEVLRFGRLGRGLEVGLSNESLKKKMSEVLTLDLSRLDWSQTGEKVESRYYVGLCLKEP